MKALSLTPCWCPAIVPSSGLASKDIENRLAWPGSAFRGPLLLHAAKGMTGKDYNDCQDFCTRAGVAWRPPPFDEVVRGGIVGWCTVSDVIMPGGRVHRAGDKPTISASPEKHPKALSRWYMGGFAFVLEHRQALPLVPLAGKQKIFEVDDRWLIAQLRGTEAWRVARLGIFGTHLSAIESVVWTAAKDCDYVHGSASNIQSLRARTGASLEDCQRALVACEGDAPEAAALLMRVGRA